MITSADQKFGPTNGFERIDQFRQAQGEAAEKNRLSRLKNLDRYEEEWNKLAGNYDSVRYLAEDKVYQRRLKRDQAAERILEMEYKAAWRFIKTGDPDFDWIVENSFGYEYELLDLVAHCPLDWNALWILAQTKHWCPQFSVRVVRAIRDGILARDVVGEKELLWFVNNITANLTPSWGYQDLAELFRGWNFDGDYTKVPF